MAYKSRQIFLPFCHNPRVWQTDRQTDRRQTDGQTEFSLLDRVCISCSAVKSGHSPNFAGTSLTVIANHSLTISAADCILVASKMPAP